MPVKAPPAPPPPYNWSGFYLGANLGGAWTSGSLNIPGNNLYGGLTEFIGGVQAGYNFQLGHLLFGVEGDFDGATFGHPALPTPTLGSVSQNWIGTIAGRVGLVEDRWLVYGKFGGGWVQSNATLNFPGVTWQGSNTSLAGSAWPAVDRTHWRRLWSYLQDRGPAGECLDCRLLQRRSSNWLPELAIANLFVSPVPREVGAMSRTLVRLCGSPNPGPR